MEELTFALNRYKVNIIDIYDELFSHDKQRVLEFCREIKKLSNTVPWEIKWNCQMRVDTADEELIQAMKDAGLNCLSLGLESYSHTVLKSMNKHITPEQIDRTLRIARRFKLSLQGNFIFGDKAETIETAKETLDYWRRNHDLVGAYITLTFINPYPGTALYKHCLTKGLISNELDFLENHILDPINMSDMMTEQEFEQLKESIKTANLFFDKNVSPYKIKTTDGLNEVHVRCPHCKAFSLYRNYFPPNRDFYRRSIVCRECQMRFFLVTPYFKMVSLLNKVMTKILGYRGWAYLKSKLKTMSLPSKIFEIFKSWDV